MKTLLPSISLIWVLLIINDLCTLINSGWFNMVDSDVKLIAGIIEKFNATILE